MGLWDKLSSFLAPSAGPPPRQEPRPGELARPAPPGIVIWDLENCGVPASFSKQLPAIARALRSTSGASRVVTAVAVPVSPSVTEQLQALVHCDVEVLTVMRPQKSATSEKKHSNADYLLKRALQRFLSSPCSGGRVTLITSDADFKSDIHHAQDFGLQVHLLCNMDICSSAMKDAANTCGDWRGFLQLHCGAPVAGAAASLSNGHLLAASPSSCAGSGAVPPRPPSVSRKAQPSPSKLNTAAQTGRPKSAAKSGFWEWQDLLQPTESNAVPAAPETSYVGAASEQKERARPSKLVKQPAGRSKQKEPSGSKSNDCLHQDTAPQPFTSGGQSALGTAPGNALQQAPLEQLCQPDHTDFTTVATALASAGNDPELAALLLEALHAHPAAKSFAGSSLQVDPGCDVLQGQDATMDTASLPRTASAHSESQSRSGIPAAQLTEEQTATVSEGTRARSRNRRCKTPMCTYFLKNQCSKGAACLFSHASDDRQPLPMAGSQSLPGEGHRRIALEYAQLVGQGVISAHAQGLAQQCGPHSLEAMQHLSGGGIRVVLKFASQASAAAALRQTIAPIGGCSPQLLPWSRRGRAHSADTRQSMDPVVHGQPAVLGRASSGSVTSLSNPPKPSCSPPEQAVGSSHGQSEDASARTASACECADSAGGSNSTAFECVASGASIADSKSPSALPVFETMPASSADLGSRKPCAASGVRDPANIGSHALPASTGSTRTSEATLKRYMVAISRYPSGLPASQIEMHAAASAISFGSICKVTVHCAAKSPHAPVARIQFHAAACANSMKACTLQPMAGTTPGFSVWHPSSKPPQVLEDDPGHTFILLQGFDGKAQPAVATAHTATLFKCTLDMHFAVPVPGRNDDTAVLIGLTQKAAAAFESWLGLQSAECTPLESHQKFCTAGSTNLPSVPNSQSNPTPDGQPVLPADTTPTPFASRPLAPETLTNAVLPKTLPSSSASAALAAATSECKFANEHHIISATPQNPCSTLVPIAPALHAQAHAAASFHASPAEMSSASSSGNAADLEIGSSALSPRKALGSSQPRVDGISPADAGNSMVTVSGYPAGLPACQVQMHAAASAALHGPICKVSVHLGNSPTVGTVANLHFFDEGSAKQMQAEGLHRVMGATLELKASSNLPGRPRVAMPEAAGFKFALVYGYAADLQPAARRAHTASAFSDIAGVNFIVATKCFLEKGAVLVGLTDQAAFAFASRHIYGLKGPAASQQLKWQLISLESLRTWLGLKSIVDEDPPIAHPSIGTGSNDDLSKASSQQEDNLPRPEGIQTLEDSVPSVQVKGQKIWKLSHFPIRYPLGHVQLYAAAAAAAVGAPLQIWVGYAKMAPHRPVAGIEVASWPKLQFHGTAVTVMSHRVTTLPWNGPASRVPAPAAAEGYSVVILQGFSLSQGLTDVQAIAEQCCQDIDGVHFIMATYRRDTSHNLSPMAILSLSMDASWALMARYPARALSCPRTGTALECMDISLPEAGRLLAAPCSWSAAP
ncbi:hypothetical protein WJX74_010962 [Apatococcus lobatus]|uniref:C3H1-type domain-containing protein n=1 Tax=Apatococcus lobatus TaxID=904363 RepID=A0AAW1Q5P1_9CHLO